MKIFFPRIRFLLPLFTAFFVELLQFVARAQNAEFVSFQSFEFSNDNSSNSQWFTFAIANNKSMPVNVSLNGESNSAIVLSAQLCDNSRSSLSSNDSLRPNAILALTVHSDQFKSVLLRPDTLPLVDQCPPTNLSADQSVLLLFEVQSMVNGSRGTLAVRRTDAAEGAVAFTAEGVPNELAEENAEWLLTKGQQIVLPILGNCSAGHCSELAQFSAHMAIRQGSAELALVQECPLPMDGNNSGSSLAEKQTFLLLDSFQPGEYLSLLDIRFGENGTANATIKRRNHSEESMEILHCPPPSAAVEYNESASYGNIRLFVSSSSSQPSLVAFSQFRIFNAQHLTLATERPFLSIGHLFLFLLLLVVSFVLIGFFFALFLSRRFALQQRRENCENEQRNKEETTHLEMNRVGQSEHSSRPASTISKREDAEVKINAKALEERAIGGSKGDGWM